MYGPDQQLAFPDEGQADWDASLAYNFTVLQRGYHTVAQMGTAVNTADVLWMNSGGFYLKYDPRSADIQPQAITYTAASSGDSVQVLLAGVVRSLFPVNSIVPGLDYFVASGNPGVVISSLQGHPVDRSIGYGVAGGALYFQPRRDTLANVGPLREFFPITKSDTASFNPPLRGIMFGMDANVSLKTVDTNSLGARLFKGGVLYPLNVTQVYTTGTDSVEITGGR